MIRFAVVSVIAITVLGFTSLIWPRFTSSPRPPALGQVHDFVLKTQIGKNAAQVLGVSVESAITPINLNSEIASIGSMIVSGVEQKAQEVIMGQVATQLLNQYSRLPANEQQIIKETICRQ